MFAQTNHQIANGPGKDAAANHSRADKAAPQPNPWWQSIALRPFGIQPQLAVSQPDDPYEQEADRVADRVMRMPSPTLPSPALQFSDHAPGRVQRKCASCEEEEEEEPRVQRKGESNSCCESQGIAPSIVSQAVNSPSQPLDASDRSFMESRFGRDFSQIRVHHDSRAAASAKAIHASAYTLGSHIVFGSGRYQPGSNHGRRLLAHELAHVVQSGPNMVRRQTDQTEESRRRVRSPLGQYIQEMRFAKVVNDCPADSAVRLLDALMRVRGRVDRNTQCLEFFRRRLGSELLPMLSPYRPPSFTVDPSLTTSAQTQCPPRQEAGHPPPVATIRLGPSLCTSPHLDRVIVQELAHQAGCGPRGTAAAWDEGVADQAADICIGSVREQLELRDRAAAIDPAASPEDWNFTGEDLRAIQQRRMQLRFAADSNWFPAPLRENLRNTLIYLLAPSSAETRTAGINPTDLFHGHLVVPHGEDPPSLLSQRDAWTGDLVSTRQRVLGPDRRVTDQNLEAYRREVGRLAISSGPLLTAALRARGAAVIYHTFEFPAAGTPEAGIRPGAPRRNFRTPLFTNVPEPYSAPDLDNAASYQRDYTHILQFAFLVDRTGVIHVRPDFTQELSDVVGRPMNR